MGGGRQGREDMTTAVGLCGGKNGRVISGEERLECAVASGGVLTCLPNVL